MQPVLKKLYIIILYIMEIIIEKVNYEFQTKLINILNENLHKFKDNNDRINYINLYHKDWDNVNDSNNI
jgi:hypothetical protein